MEEYKKLTEDDNLESTSHNEEKLINEMANNEYSHLETAMEYEKRIRLIQKSSHVTYPWFSFLHNYMRMKYSWYYKWHLKNNFNIIHFTILSVFIISIIIIIYLKFVHV